MSDSTNYKEARLVEQIQWHSTKARHNKLRFRQFQIITLVASAIIPIMNVIPIGHDDSNSYDILNNWWNNSSSYRINSVIKVSRKLEIPYLLEFLELFFA